MEYKVYEWDFFKREGILKLVADDFNYALSIAKGLAKQFCQDEQPKKVDYGNGVIAFVTDCDFGAVVKPIALQ